MNISITSGTKSTALYCDASVLGEIILLIVDSGSSGSVISSHLLRNLGIKGADLYYWYSQCLRNK